MCRRHQVVGLAVPVGTEPAAGLYHHDPLTGGTERLAASETGSDFAISPNELWRSSGKPNQQPVSSGCMPPVGKPKAIG
jgi:hypothetical protein